jgi:CRP-like cAMP-binding protein
MPKNQKAAAFDAHAFLEAMGRGRTVSKHRPDDVVFSQGDRADSVYYVRTGKVKLSVTSASGKEAVIGVLGDGDFFGEGSLISQPVRLATATALSDSTLDRIDKSKMLHVLHDEPKFSDRFTAHLLTRNSRVEADLVDQLMNSSEKRLARTLLLLANFGKEGRPEPITTKISQETLAEMVGTTRPPDQLLHEQIPEAGLHRL